MFEVVKKFHISHLGSYIKDFPKYHKIAQYETYIAALKKNGNKFGLVNGSDETYVFEIDDRTIPAYMFFNKETFSHDEIDLFFYLACKIMKIPRGGGIS